MTKWHFKDTKRYEFGCQYQYFKTKSHRSVQILIYSSNPFIFFTTILYKNLSCPFHHPLFILVKLHSNGNKGFFEVIDQGAGIVGTEKDRVFDRFYRVSNHTTNGSGLGLSIVEEICKKYHFSIELKDNQPHGLVVFVSFVLDQAGGIQTLNKQNMI